MKNFGKIICKNKYVVLIIACVLLVFSLIGMKLTHINYDILVYLPDEIETVQGQKILAEDFDMGAYSIAVINNMPSKDIIDLEEDIRNIDGVASVLSLYNAIGNTISIEVLPSEIVQKVHQEKEDLIFITFDDTTSSERTINAVDDIRSVTENKVQLSGMSSMVLDTMNLSDKEITIYIVIAVILCMIVLELFLDSYLIPLILLGNIGCAILFNMGTNIFLGEISYITKALVAVLQLGVTTDFSIFLYHSYEKKKNKFKSKEEAMVSAINETFKSVVGSSFTTIVGFLALCAMVLSLGKDLGIVMAKGVLFGVLTVLTLFPSLLLIFDKIIEKTKHKPLVPSFNFLNKFIIKYHKIIFIIFLVLLIPIYLAYSKVEVYYKLDTSLPETLESVRTNKILKEKYNMVSTEIVLVSKSLSNDQVINMTNEITNLDGIEYALTFSQIKQMGITENMLNDDLVSVFENDNYQIILINSLYDIATPELNKQTEMLNTIVKKYDKHSIVAGEGPLMKDLVETYDSDYSKVNIYSIICIFIVLSIVLKSFGIPILLILSIEFAIFTNLSVSYFGGTVLPFIAPITLGTIQLGATIDYAILLTTTYLVKRKSGLKKDDAMLNTMNYCGTSILISGLCFFAATFGVGVYSDIEMIGSICTLISRGALISMFVVITVLPSILLIFDKLIIRTNKKENKKMKFKVKNIFKKTMACLLVVCTVFASIPVPTQALVKNETVYSKLNGYGNVNSLIVNEQLINNDNLDVIDDYSELNNILNINSDTKFSNKNNNLSWYAGGKDIFYQGSSNKDLPVDLKITYKLNGKNIKLKKLLGKSGNVTMELKFINKDKHGNLYTPFVSTVGTIISGDNNKNVSVTNGKVVNTGTKFVVVGIAAPGLYESLNLEEFKNIDTINISFDTTSFELSTIYSIITPKVLDSSDLKVFNKLDTVYSSVDSLKENMDKIEDGFVKVADGSYKLKEAVGDAINNLSNNNENVLNENELNNIKKKTIKGIEDIYTDEYKLEIENNAWDSVKTELANTSDDTIANYIKDAVSSAVVNYLKSVNEYDDYVLCETGKAYMEMTGTMLEDQQNACLIVQNDKTLNYVKEAATLSSSEVAGNTTYYIAEKISKSVSSSVSNETALKVAENVALSVANEVASVALNSSVNAFTELYNGVKELNNGIITLKDGVSTFNSEGISKIDNLVNDKIKNVSEKLKQLIILGENYSSFGNKSNETEGSTKFIYVVEGQMLKKENNFNRTTNVKTTFWQRIKNLFN